MIAFTNHALDHMLLSLLDAKITTNLVRLGSRSSDERINEYTLDKLERMKDGASSPLDQIVRKERFSMGQLEDEMRTILRHIQTPAHTWETVTNYLQETFPDHLDSFMSPPFWIDKLAEDLRQDIKAEGQWTTVNTKKKGRDVDIPNTIYSFWKTGQDISFLQPPQPPQSTAVSAKGKRGKQQKKKQEQELIFAAELQEYLTRMNSFFVSLGFPEGMIPSTPTASRPIDELLVVDAIWNMSFGERQTLAAFWEREMRTFAYNKHRQDYEERREEYEAACKRFNDAKDEVSSNSSARCIHSAYRSQSRRQLLSRIDLIGCTTNGAAKLTSLLTVSTVHPFLSFS